MMNTAKKEGQAFAKEKLKKRVADLAICAKIGEELFKLPSSTEQNFSDAQNCM